MSVEQPCAFPAACGVSPGHDQRLRQEARPGLPEATRKPPVGSLLNTPPLAPGILYLGLLAASDPVGEPSLVYLRHDGGRGAAEEQSAGRCSLKEDVVRTPT